jgi:hypothetical protein
VARASRWDARLRSMTKALLDALRVWCDQERGRRTEVSRSIGVTTQSVTDWLAGRRQPTAEQILDVQDFLEKQRNRSISIFSSCPEYFKTGS